MQNTKCPRCGHKFNAEEVKPDWRPLNNGAAKAYTRCPDCEGKLTILRYRDKEQDIEAYNAMARA